MRHVITAFLVSASLLTGCAPVQSPSSQYAAAPAKQEPHIFKPHPYTYDKDSPAALNFSSQLEMPAFQCDLEASLGRDAVRYGLKSLEAEYGNSFIECVKFAKSQGDEAVARLKSAKVPPKQLALSKDLYAKWSAYLSSMSPYRMPDPRAKAEYQAAKQALAAEVQFSN
ncbi:MULTISPECIES: hypothetical protein [unclassified Pseudomonas]|jgi:hypothetical protein|uniref:hypothetical protein n=1 Tax=unclassified Pseudomonas TaxID=196821 RepID=UPI002157AA06|nr:MULTISPECIES: hypothetical protein [unclassified Pseudomonas]